MVNLLFLHFLSFYYLYQFWAKRFCAQIIFFALCSTILPTIQPRWWYTLTLFTDITLYELCISHSKLQTLILFNLFCIPSWNMYHMVGWFHPILMLSLFLIHYVVLNIHGAHFNKPTVRNGLNYHKRNTTGSLQVVLTSFTTLHTIL